jgi:hypothetical protein
MTSVAYSYTAEQLAKILSDYEFHVSGNAMPEGVLISAVAEDGTCVEVDRLTVEVLFDE